MKVTVIFYRQYGEWYCSVPFKNREKAEDHAKRHLSDNTIYDQRDGSVLSKNTNSHVKDVTFREVELPE